MSLENSYRRAERMSQLVATGEVRNTQVLAHWFSQSKLFWYERETPSGIEVRIVDPDSRSNEPAFDHLALCQLLEAEIGDPAQGLTADGLPLKNIDVELQPRRVRFDAYGSRWCFDETAGSCTRTEVIRRPEPVSVSPDGHNGVFVRAHNLWAVDLSTNDERQLTSDGAQFNAYASDSSMRTRYPNMLSPPRVPYVAWSPCGLRVFTLRIDEREVAPVPVIEYVPFDGSQRPRYCETRWAAPGDETLPTATFAFVDVGSGAVVEADYPPVPLVRMNDSFFDIGLAWFGADGKCAYFVHVERGERVAHVVEVECLTGRARIILSEEDSESIELGPVVYARTNIHYIASRHELLWQSERSGRAQLYRYDLSTGAELNVVTAGPWRVREVIHLDEQREEVWFSASGHNADPYTRDIFRVGFDGGGLRQLTRGGADHNVFSRGELGFAMLEAFGVSTRGLGGVSPASEYFVETSGLVTGPTQTVVRDRDGTAVCQLEVADFSSIADSWQWPEPFHAIAADGETPIHGVMFKPSDFDPAKRYPVIDLIYGGPQVNYVPKVMLRGLEEKISQADALALKELGFIVVIVDGRGSSGRERAFQKHSYGHVQRASDIDDHVAAITQLAARHSFIDLERVGITGISAGGYATAHAMLARPDFFKVGVASSGNYDQRFFTHGWGERYHGLPAQVDYQEQALLPLAPKLQGKLLFTHGVLDHGCHLAPLLQLTQALANANRNFDLLLDPMRGHDRSSYITRRSWDYFVEHLLGETPPSDVQIVHGLDLMIQGMS